MRGKLIRRRKLPTALTIGPDEIRVAKAALRARPVLLAPRPQIATRKAQEHRPATRLNPLTLQRQEAFLNRIAHAYTVGSLSPASANPFARSRHASQRPQWRPSGSGS